MPHAARRADFKDERRNASFDFFKESEHGVDMLPYRLAVRFRAVRAESRVAVVIHLHIADTAIYEVFDYFFAQVVQYFFFSEIEERSAAVIDDFPSRVSNQSG